MKIANTNHRLAECSRNLIYHIAWLLAFTMCAEAFMYGQATNGTILGTVTDTAGAVVTKANVDVVNVATGVVHATQTTDSGDFTVPYLAPGTYRVTVQSSGFQRALMDKVDLAVDQRVRVNVTMKPGAISEVVEVQANPVALDTDSAAVAQLVSSEQVDQLPLNGRNFLQLLFIGAGAVETSGEQSAFRQGAGDAISINGGRPESNNYTLDGLSNTDTRSEHSCHHLVAGCNPGVQSAERDLLCGVRLQRESSEHRDQERHECLHGSAFLFDRNDAFDAKGPFQTEPSPITPESIWFRGWRPGLYSQGL